MKSKAVAPRRVHSCPRAPARATHDRRRLCPGKVPGHTAPARSVQTAMLLPLLLLVAGSAGYAGPRSTTLLIDVRGCAWRALQAPLELVPGAQPRARRLDPPPGVTGALRLRGGGRAWVRKTVKAASKKERQRKKRNIDSTNLRASVKLDPGAVPPGLLLQNELEHKALEWVLGGCRPEALPTVEPMQAIDEARQRLQATPDKPKRVLPRALKSHQEDVRMQDGDDEGEEQSKDEVGSRGSRAVPKGKSSRGMASPVRHKSSGKHSEDAKRPSRKRSGLRLRGGAPDTRCEDSSSVVSDDSSSVVSETSSSFALAKAATPTAPGPVTAAAAARKSPTSRTATAVGTRCMCACVCVCVCVRARVRASSLGWHVRACVSLHVRVRIHCFCIRAHKRGQYTQLTLRVPVRVKRGSGCACVHTGKMRHQHLQDLA